MLNPDLIVKKKASELQIGDLVAYGIRDHGGHHFTSPVIKIEKHEFWYSYSTEFDNGSVSHVGSHVEFDIYLGEHTPADGMSYGPFKKN